MKTTGIIYWITTALISAMMTFSAFAYLSKPAMKLAFQHLQFPDYFRVELAIAKLIGVVILLFPFPKVVKEWAYAGFAITFISAFIAHTASGDPTSVAIAPIVALVLLLASRFFYDRKSKTQTQTSSIQKAAFA